MSDDIDFLAGNFPIKQPAVIGPNDNVLQNAAPIEKPLLNSQRSFNASAENTFSKQMSNSYDPSTNLDLSYPVPQGYDLTPYFKGPLPPREQVTVLEKIPIPMKIGSPSYMGINCIDISNHITQCPVCSKLYKSNSNIYIGIILVLIILLVFLGKKVFD